MLDTLSMAIAIEKLRQADLNLLVYFVVLVEEKSVSRAAARLRLTQPALSRALQRLRELFQDELLVRGAKGYQTTPRGEDLLGQLALVLPQLNTLITSNDFDPATDDRSFNIAAADSLAYLYCPLLAARCAVAPQMTFAFFAYGADRYDPLEANSQDLVLDVDFRMLPGTLRKEVLFEDQYVCVVAKDAPYGSHISLEEYVAAGHASINFFGNMQSVPDAALSKLGLRRRFALTVPYAGVLLRVVSESQLIVTMPKRLAMSLMDREEVRLLDPPMELSAVRYVMVWHKRYEDDPRHLWLRQLFRDVTQEITRDRSERQQRQEQPSFSTASLT
jgi:DNA-binding transcriptional LysR family regulator